MTYHGLIFSITQHPFLSRSLGAHRIAHHLREQGWDIEVVDWANWWTPEHLKEFVKSRHKSTTKFIAFSHLYSIWFDHMEDFGFWIKKNYPDVALLSGSSVNPMFQSQCIDWYVQGFGEHAMVELLKYLTGNVSMPKFHLLGSRKVIAANEHYPAYPMQSLMVKYESRDFINSHEWLTIETSRGCKFKCAFCQFPILGIKEDTSRSSDDFVIQMKDAYDRFGVTSYMIADETFNDRSEKITKFANAVQELNFTPWFSAYVRLDLLAAKPDDVQELLRMNVLGHFYGIESMNHKSAQAVGKGMSSHRIKQTLLEIKNYFLSNGRRLYRGHIGLIAGLPFETHQTLMDTLQWLLEHWQGQSFGIHRLGLPRPGSEVKPSDMSQNLSKYGYEEMTEQEIHKYATKKYNFVQMQRKGDFKEFGDDIIWKNQNMNMLEAMTIIEKIYEAKLVNDFRPGNFMINYRLTKHLNIEQLLQLSFDQYDNMLDHNIQRYVTQKLSLTTP